MRVCLINLWDRGGPVHYTSQLANSLSKLAGLDLAVVLPQKGIHGQSNLFDSRAKLVPVNVITDRSFRQLVRIPFFFWQMLRFPKKIEQLHPDVIHIIHTHVWLLFALPLLAKRYPVVSTLHDIEPHPGLDRTLRKRLEIQAIIRYSKHLFVHGQALKERLLHLYPWLLEEHIHVIPHGDFAFFRRWSSEVPEEPRTILFFGRIRDYKGLPLLYDSYVRVLQSIPETRLIIAGEGPLGDLQPLFENIPNCEIYNRYIPDDEVSNFFERSSMIVCPYTEASQSGIIPVAYAFKKPVVATCVGCLPESVDNGNTGLLIPPGNPQALADAIIALIRDPVRRHEMGNKGNQKMIAELGWDKIAQSTQNVYIEATTNFR